MEEAERQANLASYVKDHRAGAFGAMELIDHLKKRYADDSLGEFFDLLHEEVSADDEVLRGLQENLDAGSGGLRKAGAWIMEKISQLKLAFEKNEVGGLGLLEALEAIELGIRGKQLLWRALAIAAETRPELRTVDYAKLEARAVLQQESVEAKRIAAARAAFVEWLRDDAR